MIDLKMLTDSLKLIQDAYHKRDVSEADKFIAELFHSGEKVTVAGTSDNELRFDLETIKQLFISDWKSWGDLDLQIDKAIIRVHHDTAWVHLPGTVRYVFSDNDETYRKFVGFIEDFFDGKSCDSKKPDKMKLTEINWLLAHLLHQREPKLNREYLMSLRIFLIYTKRNAEWKVNYIRFSVPKWSMFADQRFSDYTPYEKSYLKETERYEKHSNYVSLDMAEKGFLQSFQNLLVSKTSVTTDDFAGMFTEESCLISTGKEVCAGKDSVIKQLTLLKSYWDDFKLNINTGIYGSNGDSLWLHTNGIKRKRIRNDELLAYTGNDVKNILNGSRPDKDKLFLIRKSIATTLYEQSFGEEYVYPYRFDAFMTKLNGKFCFDYIQLSYPFNTILEQIND